MIVIVIIPSHWKKLSAPGRNDNGVKDGTVITYSGFPGSRVGVFLEGWPCALLFLSIVLAYRTDISCRVAIHSVRCISSLLQLHFRLLAGHF